MIAKSGGGARSGQAVGGGALPGRDTGALYISRRRARMYRQIEKRKSKIRRQVESFQLVLDDGDRVTVNKPPHVDELQSFPGT